MSAVQPDLFGEYDRREQERKTQRQPAECPSCGTTEPNGYLLSINHGYDPISLRIGGFPQGEHPIYGDKCLAQTLVTSHITYQARNGDTQALALAMDRGRELGLDVEAIKEGTTT
ncbi:hypothetical protein [Pseudactinotalea sp. Z1732]|uniref:hypothetical protein n=1 Tax=Pseudactinotalea sp. Z1732 TaxID=3413026 RepID=UPI003C7BDB11